MSDLKMSEPSGVLLINKHAGVTSHDIVGKVRRLYHTRRVGHAGTLDPMATGVLVVLVGRTAKANEYLSGAGKHYRAGLRLGITTDTEDTTGTVLSRFEGDLPDFAALESVLPLFRGAILQTPPMYSALKVGGKKLVDLARQGVSIEREAREIEIYTLTADKTDSIADFTLDVECSGGTYIRTLCADIGERLGCGGVMSSLMRSSACGFLIEQTHTVAELEEMSDGDRLACLLPTEQLFQSLPALHLPAFYERLCRSGCEIYFKKLSQAAPPIGTRLRLCSADGSFFALGEVGEYPDGIAVKSIKLFDI